MTYWNSTQFGSTVLPESLLDLRLVRGREVWKGTLMVADVEQVDTNRRVRIPQRKAQREGGDLDQSGDNSKNRRRTIKFIGWDLRFWELQPWQGIFQVRGEVQEDLLGESDGFPPTKQEVHCTSTQAQYRWSVISSPKLIRKIFGKTCHELLQQADLRRLLQVKKVALMVQVCRRFLLFQACLLLHLRHHQRRMLNVRYQIQHQSNVSEDRQARRDPLRNPTNHAMSMQGSQRSKVESSWQVRWDPLLSIFWISKTWCGRMLIRIVNKFSMSHSPSASDSFGTLGVKCWKSQCRGRITSAAHRHAEKLRRLAQLFFQAESIKECQAKTEGQARSNPLPRQIWWLALKDSNTTISRVLKCGEQVYTRF